MHLTRLPCAIAALALLGFAFDASAQSSYARAGWTADLVTRAHGVSGRVTLLDENTFRVDNFNYDGGGISVFFYLGLDDSRNSFIAGIPGNPSSLLGPARVNASLTFDVPNGETFDGYNAIALWCVPAQQIFGSGSFVAPVPEPASLSMLAFSALLLRRRRRH